MPLERTGDPSARALHGRVWLCLAALVIFASLGGCALLEDASEARLCRTAIPALNRDYTALAIVATQRLVGDQGVKILYRVKTPDNESRLRSLACSFGAHPSGEALPRHLIGVTTEEGALGVARLHILKRFWLEAAEGSIADPAPVPNADRVPEVPRPFAIGLQSVLAALPQMSVYALLAAAYALIYGLVGRINLAFGDFATLGSYGALMGLVVMSGSGSLALGAAAALLLALWTATAHGALIGRFVFGPLARQRGQVVLIASTGLALFIAEYVRVAQGSGMKWTPPILNLPIALARAGPFVVTATLMALVVTLVALTTACALLFLMRRSRFGRTWRACADDPIAAGLMGVSSTDVLLRTFVLASLLAGLGGAITTLYYGGVSHSSGLLVGLKALIAAILGGVASISGAFVGGLLLGLAEALWSAVFPIELRDPIIFGLLAVVLVIRPGGIAGTPELEPTH